VAPEPPGLVGSPVRRGTSRRGAGVREKRDKREKGGIGLSAQKPTSCTLTGNGRETVRTVRIVLPASMSFEASWSRRAPWRCAAPGRCPASRAEVTPPKLKPFDQIENYRADVSRCTKIRYRGSIWAANRV